LVSAGKGVVNLAQTLPYINEAFIILSAISMAIGWYLIRQRRVEAHKRFMLTGSVLAALFFISYVLKTFVYGDTAFGGPAQYKLPYQIFLQAHSILATVAAVLGVITLVFAFKANFRKHRKIGPWTASTWFVTAATGLAVFLMLYVVFPPGPTTNVFRAWIGH
jgi:putative membrane protein